MAKKINDGCPWTALDDTYLRSHYNGHNMEEVADALGRTKEACKSRAKRLMMNVSRHEWTPSQEGLLRSMRRKGCTYQEIADEIFERYGVLRSAESTKQHHHFIKLHNL